MDAQYFRLLVMGFECSFLILLSPVGWLLVALALISGVMAWSRKAWPLKTWLFLAWPALISEILTAVGTLYWCDWRYADGTLPPEAKLLMVLALGGYVAGAALLIGLNKRSRLATCAVLSIGGFPVLGCYLVATMATSGKWL
jgi:hypothetical protein